jgi:hypothetical protein
MENEKKEETEVIKNNEQKKEIDKAYHATDVFEVPPPAAKDSEAGVDAVEVS